MSELFFCSAICWLVIFINVLVWRFLNSFFQYKLKVNCRNDFLFLWLLFWLAAEPTWAENFTVSARISCPASLTGTKLDPSFKVAPTQVACAGMRVSAMDADTAWDEYCGSAYTNSRGRVNFAATCSDAIGGPPDVYLKVEGRSFYGFSIGTHDAGFWDALLLGLETLGSLGTAFPFAYIDYLTKHETFAWITKEQLGVNNAHLDFGDLFTGMGFDKEFPYSQFAARQFWATQYAMSVIRSSTSLWPMDFNYTVDAPLGYPTTLWDTIIVDSDDTSQIGSQYSSSAARALAATPHEIGHVIHNTYHVSNLPPQLGGQGHWNVDAPDYMTTHSYCEKGHFMTLAWYEGFANWVQHLAYSDYDWQSNVLNLPSNTGTCSDSGFDLEGNVTAVLDALYFGPLKSRHTNDASLFNCDDGFIKDVDKDGVVRCRQLSNSTCSADRTIRQDFSGFNDVCIMPGVVPISRALFERMVRNCSSQPLNCTQLTRYEPMILSTCPSESNIQRITGRDTCHKTQPPTSAYQGISPLPRGDGTPDRVLTRTTSGEYRWQELMDANTLIGSVKAAGVNSHRMLEIWNGWLLPWCKTNDSQNIPKFCNPSDSPDFVKIVAPAAKNFP